MSENLTFTSEITVRLVQSLGGDAMVIAAARVSTVGAEALDRVGEPNALGPQRGLIHYLMKHRHGTPFEHSCLTFFIHAPAFVWWEMVRHRIGHSFNLESARYKRLDPVFWIPRPERRMFRTAQFSPARPTELERLDPQAYELFLDALKLSYALAFDVYEESLERGIASEVARAALPFAIYYSGWVTVNPRSLMAFLSLRTHDRDAKFVSYPQAEIEEVARAAEAVFKEGWPLTHEAFCAQGRVGP